MEKMDEHTSHELAYKKGYEKGKQDAAPMLGWWNKKTDEKFVGYDADGKIKYRKVYSYYCGRCALGTAVRTNYCPHCGADMREPPKGE